VFGGFSPESLKDRILDSDCQTVITADEGLRGGKKIPLKNNVDEALLACPNVHTVLVITRTGAEISWNEECDVRYEEIIKGVSDQCEPESMESEDPLFILYTSGSTGKPKGVLHTTAGYLLQTAMSHRMVFDYKDEEVYWCTADVGWITGHTYVAYGPTAIGVTQLIFEGVPTYPNAGRFWQLIENHKINIFYTAPTAIRALIKTSEVSPDTHPKNYNLNSLRILGTVGEPINPSNISCTPKDIFFLKVKSPSTCIDCME
jgi:acetyl-CoA synthetase